MPLEGRRTVSGGECVQTCNIQHETMLFIEYKTLRRKERRGEGYEKEIVPVKLKNRDYKAKGKV